MLISLKINIRSRRTVYLIVLCLIIYCLYARISRLKLERERFIRGYDLNDNFSIYDSTEDDNTNVKKHVDLDKIKSIKLNISKLNKNVEENTELDMEKVHLVIVVLVHNRLFYLLEFLKSLQYVLGIKNTVLIVSHDYYDQKINEVIATVQFVKALQIFYPFSKQLHPNAFPGDDEKYCDEGWSCVKDINGQRNSNLAQLKHHWWWTANYVFDRLEMMQEYEGSVVFLEEDQYIVMDFFYVLRILEKGRKSSCHRCDMLCAGAYPPILSKYAKNSSLLVEEFGATPYNMGVSFNRTTWKRIKRLRQLFCYFNDYDWVASLRYLSSRLPEGRFNMLSIAGARVVRVGRCKKQSPRTVCDSSNKVNNLIDFMEVAKREFFPKTFVMKGISRYTKIEERGNFSDVRDHELCMHISKKGH